MAEHTGKKSNRKTKCLCGSVLVLLLLVIILIVILIIVSVQFHKEKQKSSDKNEATGPPMESKDCLEPECLAFAGTLLKNMDPSVDPCTDFFEYTCGGWLKNTAFSPDEGIVYSFTKAETDDQIRLNKLLEQPGNTYKGRPSTGVQKAKDFYAACMNVSSTENFRAEQILKLIKELGSWTVTTGPESGTWNEATWDLFDTMLNFQNAGFGAQFFQMTADLFNRTANSVKLAGIAALTLDVTLEYTDSNKNIFMDYFVGITKLLGGNETDARRYGEDIWQLESELYQAFVPLYLADPYDSNIRVVSEVEPMMEDIVDFRRFMEEYFETSVASSEQVFVYFENALPRIGEAVQKYSKETLANYMVWHVVSSLVPYMNEEFVQLKTNSGLMDATSMTDARWKTCLKRTTEKMHDIIGAMYVEAFFEESTKEQVEDMVNRIQRAFRERLVDNTWMDDTTRNRAIEKLDAMTSIVGYPPNYDDPAGLDNYLDEVHVTSDDAFQNQLNFMAFDSMNQKKKLGTEPDTTLWDMPASTLNALHASAKNAMQFNAGFIQPPYFYNLSSIMAINYGAYGGVIGHEMTHGFDTYGMQYDKNGNKITTWFTPTSKTTFQQRAQCFTDQYNRYTLLGVQADGDKTQAENIADAGGLKSSFKAYKDWLDDHGGEWLGLPGIKATAEQLFFLGYGQAYCEYLTPDMAAYMTTVDVHSHADVRSNGGLMNTEEFATAFNCPAGSPMNPTTKCVLW